MNVHELERDKGETLSVKTSSSSMGMLIRELASDAAELAKGEAALAKLELQQAFKRASVAFAGAILGGIVVLFGLGLLCMTAVVALEPLIAALWLRMLLMSVAYLVLGTMLSMSFLARVRQISFEPKAATEEARQTVADIKAALSHE